MEKIHLAVSGDMATLFTPGRFNEATTVHFDPRDDARRIAKQIGEGLSVVFWKKKLVMAANFRRTLVRIVNADACRPRFWPLANTKKVPDVAALEIVSSAFPLTAGFDFENFTYDVSLFDGSRYFCCGLPVYLCQLLADIGTRLTGWGHYIDRIDTIEHLMFVEFARGIAKRIIVFPQEKGYRLLTCEEGLPSNAFYISRHPTRCIEDFCRLFGANNEKGYELMLIYFGHGADVHENIFERMIEWQSRR